MSPRRSAWSLIAIGLLVALPTVSAGATAAMMVVPAPVPFFLTHGASHASTTSSNWAGFAVTGSAGSVTFVNGSWIQPAIVSCPLSKATYSSFWVGIDGYSSSTVEQTGTDSDCHSGKAQYYAWYEFYPAASVLIKTVTISAGDTIYASVSFASSTFTVFLKDVTTGKSFSTTGSVTSAQRTSAEWIAEAPSSGRILPLANFGTVHFGMDSTFVAATNSATLGGTTGLIGSWSTAVSIDMVGARKATLTKASTSAISSDNSSFTVTWKAAGP
jgi:hypothetical protein